MAEKLRFINISMSRKKLIDRNRMIYIPVKKVFFILLFFLETKSKIKPAYSMYAWQQFIKSNKQDLVIELLRDALALILRAIPKSIFHNKPPHLFTFVSVPRLVK